MIEIVDIGGFMLVDDFLNCIFIGYDFYVDVSCMIWMGCIVKVD